MKPPFVLLQIGKARATKREVARCGVELVHNVRKFYWALKGL